jgi:Tol biopolymer transport system component
MYQQRFIIVNSYEVDHNPIESLGWVKTNLEETKMKLGKLLFSIVVVSLIMSMAIPMATAKKPPKPPGGEDPPADPVIAYTGRQGKDYTLNVMNADGSNQAIVYRQYLGINQATWSPDGSSIAVQVNVKRDGVYTKDLYRIDVSVVDGEPQGSDPIVLAQDTGKDPSWSPNGDVIAFVAEMDGSNRLIQTITYDGGTVETIYTAPYGYNVHYPTWNSDATKMVFTQGASGQGSLIMLDLSDGSTTTINVPPSNGIGFIDWARTQDVLALYMVTTAGEGGICLLDLTETSPTYEPIWVDGNPRSPSWSPDDSQLVFDTMYKRDVYTSVYTFSTGEIEHHARGRHPDWCRDIQQ